MHKYMIEHMIFHLIHSLGLLRNRLRIFVLSLICCIGVQDICGFSHVKCMTPGVLVYP